MLDLIIPDWPAPSWIKAFTTTRRGGFSHPPFDSLNLSPYVGDNNHSVAQNHQLLKRSLGLTKDPLWLKQVHGTKAIPANTLSNLYSQQLGFRQVPRHCELSDHTSENSSVKRIVADAVYSHEPQVVCAVQTADCLPILVCNRTHYGVAAIHAGWKGLAAGIIENSIQALDCPPIDLIVWLGPAIGPQAFVVGEEVITAFTEKNPTASTAFQRIDNAHWLANLYQLAKLRLHSLGISAIYGGKYCTYTNKKQFFSFRRDKVTGRMASLIWIIRPLPESTS